MQKDKINKTIQQNASIIDIVRKQNGKNRNIYQSAKMIRMGKTACKKCAQKQR